MGHLRLCEAGETAPTRSRLSAIRALVAGLVAYPVLFIVPVLPGRRTASSGCPFRIDADAAIEFDWQLPVVRCMRDGQTRIGSSVGLRTLLLESLLDLPKLNYLAPFDGGI